MSVVTCPCCGSPVRVHTSSEGTSSYEPVVPADAHVDSEEPLRCRHGYLVDGDNLARRCFEDGVPRIVPPPADALGQEGSSPKHSPVEAREALGGVGEVDACEEPRGAAAFESARRRGHRAPPADALDKARELIQFHRDHIAGIVAHMPLERQAEYLARHDDALAALAPKAEPVCGRASGVRCEEVGEGICQKCGRDYPVWFAPSDVWNLACRGGVRANPDEYAFLCLDCFAMLAEERGVKSTGWALLPDYVGTLNPKLVSGARLSALERVADAARKCLLAEDADADAILALARGNGSTEDQVEASAAADRAVLAVRDALIDLERRQR